MSTSKKKKAKTPSLAKKMGKSMLVQAEKKFVKDTSPSINKRKTRTSTVKKSISLGTNQHRSSSLIMIGESPQDSTKYHNISVLIDAATHTAVNEENVEKEYDILFSTPVHRLRKKKMTPSA